MSKYFKENPHIIYYRDEADSNPFAEPVFRTFIKVVGIIMFVLLIVAVADYYRLASFTEVIK